VTDPVDRARDAADAEADAPTPPKAKKRRRSGSVGETLGGIIVGFDQQIMRTLPPPHELVLKGAPVRGVSGADGGELQITFPEDDHPTTDGDPSSGEPPNDGQPPPV
jgi:hypothetical protein